MVAGNSLKIFNEAIFSGEVLAGSYWISKSLGFLKATELMALSFLSSSIMRGAWPEQGIWTLKDKLANDGFEFI